MNRAEKIVVSFVLSHLTEHSSEEATRVIDALASLTSDVALKYILFQKSKTLEELKEKLKNDKTNDALPTDGLDE